MRFTPATGCGVDADYVCHRTDRILNGIQCQPTDDVLNAPAGSTRAREPRVARCCRFEMKLASEA